MRITILFALAITGLCAETPSEELYQAIRGNDLARLQRLIKDPANVNVKDRHGATPLMYAAAVGSVDAVKMLLGAGADAKARNSFEATALMWGVVNAEKVRLLVNAGADVNARSKQGMTPVLIAASNAGSIEIVRLLLAKGAEHDRAPMANRQRRPRQRRAMSWRRGGGNPEERVGSRRYWPRRPRMISRWHGCSLKKEWT